MYCSSCGKQLETGARFCPFCGASRDASAGAQPPFGGLFEGTGKLVRPRNSRMIAGVCAGFSEHYGWDLNVVRIVSVAVTLFTGVTLFAYLIAWIIIPEAPYALPAATVPSPPPPVSSQ